MDGQVAVRVALTLSLLTGCAGTAPSTDEPAKPRAPKRPAPAANMHGPRLSLYAEVNVEPWFAIDGLDVGGLSAVVARNDELWFLSDGHGEHGPPRLFTTTMRWRGGGARDMSPGSRLDLAAWRALPLRLPEPLAAHFDGEGMALLPSGLVVSTESSSETPLGIYPVADDGSVGGAFALPARLGAARPNLGLEGLSSWGPTLYAAVESALTGDGLAADANQGATVRILRRVDGEVGQFAYRTEPVPRVDGEVAVALNGVSALAAMSDDRLLVLERAYVRASGRHHNFIRIYLTSLAGSAPILSHDARAAEPLPKTLVLDLADVAAQLTPPRLDNFEGMAFGPELPDGRRSLILVSDDNFSFRDCRRGDVGCPRQRTAVLIFAVDGV